MASISSTPRRPSLPSDQKGDPHDSITPVISTSIAILDSPVLGLGPELEPAEASSEQSSVAPQEYLEPTSRQRTLKLELKFSWKHIILAILVVLLILALALGLSLGLTRKYQLHIAPAPIDNGAINGSGVVAIDLDNKSTITAYTQNADGVIVVSQYANENWTGGALSNLITANGSFNGEDLTARKGTPLMAESYARDGELIWHLFYITVDGYLVDWVNSNLTEGWTLGTLRSGNYKASNSLSVGLTVCVNSNWYGAPWNASGLGFRLYYGNSDDQIQELGWNHDGPTTWFVGKTFNDSNGAGGVECTVGEESITYVWMENLSGELTSMWYDFNLSAATPYHTVGEWKAGQTYGNIMHNSAISGISDFVASPPRKLIHFQTPELDVVELISIGHGGETDTWDNNQTPYIVGTVKGTNGTRIGSDVLYTGIGGGQEIHVMYQTNSSDMVDWIRDLTDENWAPKFMVAGAPLT